jgi:O-antigen ligase
MLFFGTWGYVPILMPRTAGALTAETQISQQHSINHIVLALVWSGIFYYILKSRFRLRFDLLAAKIALAYTGFAMLSIVWSTDRASTFSTGMNLIFTTFLAIHLVSKYSSERLVVLLAWLGFILAVSSAFFAVFLPGYGVDHYDHPGAWQGVYAQKNSLGIVMVYMTAIALSLKANTFVEKLWKSAIFVLCAAEAVLSQSREAWIGCAVLLLMHFLLKGYARFSLSSRGSVLLIGFVSLVLAVTGGAALAAYILVLLGRDVTLSGRTDLWQAVLEQCKLHPFTGYGLNAFWGSAKAFPVYLVIHWIATSAHDGYLECLLELGAFGLFLLLALFLLPVRNSVKVLTSQVNFDDSKAWIYCLLAIALFNITANITGISNSISWVLLVCSACALEQNARKQPAA